MLLLVIPGGYDEAETRTKEAGSPWFSTDIPSQGHGHNPGTTVFPVKDLELSRERIKHRGYVGLDGEDAEVIFRYCPSPSLPHPEDESWIKVHSRSFWDHNFREGSLLGGWKVNCI